MFEVELPSDLARKIKGLEQLEETLPEIRETLSRNAAFYFRRKIKDHIREQDLEWEELSENWKQEKEAQGYDPRIWVARGLLRRNLKVVKRGEANYTLEVPPSPEYPNGTAIRTVMFVLEFGNLAGTIPARPLFRPTKREVEERLITETRKANKRIIQALTKSYNLNQVKAIAPEWEGE